MRSTTKSPARVAGVGGYVGRFGEVAPDRFAAARENLPASARILIVDDNSPGGTGEMLAAADPGISMLHRSRKEGIGPAYIAGGAGFAGSNLAVSLATRCLHGRRRRPAVPAGGGRRRGQNRRAGCASSSGVTTTADRG
ncbi:MAG: glycosyltransferase [Solirubrobacterales bacterium]